MLPSGAPDSPEEIRTAESFINEVNSNVYSGIMSDQVQVQLRVPKKMVKEIDSLIKKGHYKGRSDAIRAMISAYQEREKTRAFLSMLNEASKEAEKHPKRMIKLRDL